MSQDLSHIFSSNGTLSQKIKGFQPRAEQTTMAIAVEQAIKTDSTLIVEAGTGTGKTFAYLVPIILAKQKTIISTGSKNLQDQLYKRDLPTICHALKFSGKIALLKGRSNYLCLEKLAQINAQGLRGDKNLLPELAKIQKWRNGTQTGDLSECHTIAENSPIIPQVISSNDNCLGSDCPYIKDCFVSKARKQALDADIVVVNHHLFFADMAVKENGFGELIPTAETIIFDEAHQLPDIATQYFGESLTSYQLFELVKDIQLLQRVELRDMEQLAKAADLLQKTIQDFRLLFGENNSKGNLREWLIPTGLNCHSQSDHQYDTNAMEKGVVLLRQRLEFIQEIAKSALGRSLTLDTIFERTSTIKLLLERLTNTTQIGYCYWYETKGKHFALHITPLSIAEKFSEQLKKQSASWIFTSATLEVDGNFEHYRRRLGIIQAKELVLQSPFNYPKQAMLCVPRYLPATNQKQTLNQLGEMLLPVIETNQGRCFLLCTSYSMMKGLAEFLREKSTLNILLQGETAKSRLLEQFLQQPQSVLVATQSFWEGIDVRGDALSLVIIDKLPFASPDEPLLKARIEDCQLQGGDPFQQIQIPQTVITLKQGVGRLIRDINDRGVIIICDSRLVTRAYGETFLRSLPPAYRTRDLSQAIKFLQTIQTDHLKNQKEQ